MLSLAAYLDSLSLSHLWSRTLQLYSPEHDLWRPVPPGRDVLGHEATGRLTSLSRQLRVRLEASGEAKVTDLELAVSVDEEVAGLEVAVQDRGAVDVAQAAQRLVDERLEVRVREGLA